MVNSARRINHEENGATQICAIRQALRALSEAVCRLLNAPTPRAGLKEVVRVAILRALEGHA